MKLAEEIGSLVRSRPDLTTAKIAGFLGLSQPEVQRVLDTTLRPQLFRVGNPPCFSFAPPTEESRLIEPESQSEVDDRIRWLLSTTLGLTARQIAKQSGVSLQAVNLALNRKPLKTQTLKSPSSPPTWMLLSAHDMSEQNATVPTPAQDEHTTSEAEMRHAPRFVMSQKVYVAARPDRVGRVADVRPRSEGFDYLVFSALRMKVGTARAC